MPTIDYSEALATARIDIARLEVKVNHLSTSLANVEQSQKQLTAQLDQVLLTLSEARGGWRTLMLVGGIATTVGGALTWLIQHFVKG